MRGFGKKVRSTQGTSESLRFLICDSAATPEVVEPDPTMHRESTVIDGPSLTVSTATLR